MCWRPPRSPLCGVAPRAPDGGIGAQVVGKRTTITPSAAAAGDDAGCAVRPGACQGHKSPCRSFMHLQSCVFRCTLPLATAVEDVQRVMHCSRAAAVTAPFPRWLLRGYACQGRWRSAAKQFSMQRGRRLAACPWLRYPLPLPTANTSLPFSHIYSARADVWGGWWGPCISSTSQVWTRSVCLPSACMAREGPAAAGRFVKHAG